MSSKASVVPIRHDSINGTAEPLLASDRVKTIAVSLFYGTATATIGTASVLDLMILRRATDEAIHALTGMDAETLERGMKELLAPIDDGGSAA